MQKRPTIAVFTAPEGHYSIAKAIEHTLEDDYNVVEFFTKDYFLNFYVPIYQMFPALYKIPFKLSSNRQAYTRINKILKTRYVELFREFLDEHQPDLVINTYFSYSPGIAELAKERGIKFINVLTDPKTVHPLLISPDADVNTGFDNICTNICHEMIPEARVEATGWFVRPEFQPENDLKTLRKSLKLDPDTLTFLVTSGSEGTTMVMKLLPAFYNTETPVQIIIACGNNKTMYNSIQALRKLLNQTPNKVSLLPLHFTNKMHHYIQAADLVVGKAGPNTIFESAATHTPFFAVTHVAGQEDGNLDIIEDYGLGFVEENPIKATALLKEIVANPSLIHQFDNNLVKMAKYNAQTPQRFKKLVAEVLASA